MTLPLPVSYSEIGPQRQYTLGLRKVFIEMCDGFAVLALHVHLNNGLCDAVGSVLYRRLELTISDPFVRAVIAVRKGIADVSRCDLQAL